MHGSRATSRHVVKVEITLRKLTKLFHDSFLARSARKLGGQAHIFPDLIQLSVFVSACHVLDGKLHHALHLNRLRRCRIVEASSLALRLLRRCRRSNIILAILSLSCRAYPYSALAVLRQPTSGSHHDTSLRRINKGLQ